MRSRPTGGVAGPDEGFTLVEVLVAFFIAALTLTAALRVLGEGSNRARRGPEAALRLEEAASVLDTVAASPHLRPGPQAGAFSDGHRWRLQVTDVTAAVLPKAAGRLLRLELFEQDGGKPLLVTAIGAPAR